jgi:hypothetical protein
MLSLNRERYIDPESADESSSRSGRRPAREFARKQDTSRVLRIEASFVVEERIPKAEHAVEARDRGLDETLIDTFPCSDALSSIPDPAVECRLRA